MCGKHVISIIYLPSRKNFRGGENIAYDFCRAYNIYVYNMVNIIIVKKNNMHTYLFKYYTIILDLLYITLFIIIRKNC